MKILISGFKPFQQQKINPSELLAKMLEESFPDLECVTLPVEFEKSFLVLDEYIQKKQPDYVLMLGQATGRKNISLEKIAHNWVETIYPDNATILPVTGLVDLAAPLAYMTQFPVSEAVKELKLKNSRVEVSFSAGTYVCNDLYFRVLNKYNNLKAVFIHVPLLPEQINENNDPVMDLELQFETIKTLVNRLRRY